MPPRRFQQLLTAAIEREGEAQRRLFDGDLEAARASFREAVELYRESWEAAPPRTYGRLVGLLKAAVLAGGGAEEANYVRVALVEASPQSSTVSYAQALAALILGQDADAQLWAGRMSAGTEAFGRTAEAIAALAEYDGGRYAVALAAIVNDFEERTQHLTGVAVADTALVLQALAARRGLGVAIESPVLPAMGR